jgi:hypothetical protein
LIVRQADDRLGTTRDERQVLASVSPDHPLVEHPLHFTARKSYEWLVDERFVEPEIDGRDWRSSHAAGSIDNGGQRRRDAVEQAGQPEPRHGGNHCVRPPAVAAGFDGIDSITGHKNASRGSCSHLASAALDEDARRLGIHHVQRFERQRDCGVCRARTKHFPEHPSKGRCASFICRLIERRQGKGTPKHFANAFSLAVTNEPVFYSLPRRRGEQARSRNIVPISR